MNLIITMLSVVVMHASFTTSNLNMDFIDDQLYYNVIVGQYRSAVRTTTQLEDHGRGDVIKLVVNKLLSESQRNLIEFAYKLWKSGKSDIVRTHFPKPFVTIFNEDPVLIINRRDGLAIKLALDTDNDGDRSAFGDREDRTSHRVSWAIYPQWENNRVYFQIWNTHRRQYLKLEVSTDSDGDHKALGAHENDTTRHEWYLYPAVSGGYTLFYIYNRAYDMPLKLGRYVDGDGDRRLWGNNGGVIGNPEHFAWYIVPF